MNCDKCNKLEAYITSGFTRHTDFVKLEDLFDELVAQEKIEYIGAYIYTCLGCQTKWRIAVPDHAFRGSLKCA